MFGSGDFTTVAEYQNELGNGMITEPNAPNALEGSLADVTLPYTSLTFIKITSNLTPRDFTLAALKLDIINVGNMLVVIEKDSPLTINVSFQLLFAISKYFFAGLI